MQCSGRVRVYARGNVRVEPSRDCGVHRGHARGLDVGVDNIINETLSSKIYSVYSSKT
jgi:hypothetical protein